VQRSAGVPKVVPAVLVLVLPLLSIRASHIYEVAAEPLVAQSFSEDFDGPAGSLPNPDHWSIDIGPSAVHGWEQGSLQTYTDSPDNIRLDGLGNLMVTARKAADSFTSARLITRGKVEFGLGTVVARIKVPAGQGIWPAFWMLGSNIEEIGWPACGEIDIMEIINEATTYNVALHAPGGDAEAKGPIADLSEDFHDYWMTRTENSITFGIDDDVLASFNPESLPPGSPWVFRDPMFVLLNIAVGGDWPGPPDESTTFPATMLVDWLRFAPSLELPLN